MTIVPALLFENRQMPAVEFWQNLQCAVRLVEKELTMVQPGSGEIEQMILRSWLTFTPPAGNA